MTSYPPPQPTDGPRVLLLVSNPFDAPVSIADDLARLADALRDLDAVAEFVVCPAEAEAVGYLLAPGGQDGFQVLHYLGHGFKAKDAHEGFLVLEDKTSGARWLEPSRLSAMLNPTSNQQFQVAVLSACHSESVASALAALGVPHIIAVDADESVTEIAAVQFFRRFYQALLTGRTVADAFRAGYTAVLTDDALPEKVAKAEAAKFKLLPDPGDHDVVIACGAPPPGARVRIRPLPGLAHPPFHQRPPLFVGRNADLHALAQLLDRGRCALIKGVSGVGKTELAKEVAHWLVGRRRARPERTALVALGNLTSSADARAAIAIALQISPAGWPADDAGANAALARELPPGTLLILDEAENLVRVAGRAARDLFDALAGATSRPLILVTSQSDVGSSRLPVYELKRLTPTAALELFERVANVTRAEIQRMGETGLLELLDYVDRLPRAVVLVAGQWRYHHELKPLLAELRRLRDEVMRDPYYPDEVKSVTVGVRLAYERLRATNTAAAMLYTLLPLFPGGLSEEGVAAIFGTDARRLVPLIENESLLERPLPDLLYLPAPFRFFAERQLPGGLAAAQAAYGPAALRFYFDFDDEPHRGWASQWNEALTRAGDAMGGVIARYALELPSIEAWLDWGYRAEPCDAGRSRAARLTASLRNLYEVTGLLRFQADRLAAALASARRCDDRAGEANVLQALGDLALREADLAAARGHYEAALAIYRQIGGLLGEAATYVGLGRATDDSDYFRRALTIHTRIKSTYDVAVDSYYYGISQKKRGDSSEASTLLTQARDIWYRIGLAPYAQAAQRELDSL